MFLEKRVPAVHIVWRLSVTIDKVERSLAAVLVPAGPLGEVGTDACEEFDRSVIEGV